MNVARDLMSVSSEVSKGPTSQNRKRSALQSGRFVDSPLKKTGTRFSIRALMHALLAVILVQASLPLSVSAQQAPLMMLPGQFDVTPTGAAAYSIPIAVSPGTGGMVPSLSLEYSSQSGDGIMGLGFSLSGLPSIGRCPRTVAQDGVKGSVNYDTDDRFCLEGQRLIAISGTYGADGTEYRTEIEGFSKVQSFGAQGTGPALFKVWTKSGQIMEFGATFDSRPIVGSTARSWALSRVTDTVGNYMTVHYTNDATNGQMYPVRIEYTGNANGGLTPYNAVEFEYNTNRPDVVPKYHAGSLMQTTVLLTNVKTYEGRTYDAQGTVTNTGTLVYDYQITYDLPTATSAGGVNRSRVTEIKLCDAAASCLPSTTFTWQGTRDQIAFTAHTDPVPADMFPGRNYVGTGDFNGDGFLDISKDPAETPVDVALGQPTAGSFLQSVWDSVVVETYTPSTFFGGMDFDLDGVTDIVRSSYKIICSGNYFCITLGQYEVAKSNSVDRFEISPQILSNIGGLYHGDFNGDGYPDRFSKGMRPHVVIFGNGELLVELELDSYLVLPENVGASVVFIADFNGDGCSDILSQGTSDNISSLCGDQISSYSVSDFLTGNKLFFADFNGDGKADILVTNATEAGSLQISTGAGFVQSSYEVPAGWAKYLVRPADINSDGRSDVVLVAPGSYGGTYHGSSVDHEVYLSTGDGFVSAHTIANGEAYNEVAVADWTNDGNADIWIQPRPTSDEDSATTSTLHQVSYTPELVSSVSNGLGITTTFSYDRLNAGTSLYTKLSDATYPQVDIIGPFYVVSQVDSDNGIGGTYSSTYKYEGLKATHDGRGFLGFKRHWVEDPQTGVEQETEFRQDWPYLGLVAQETKRHGAQQLNSTVNSFAADDLGDGRRFVKLTQTDQASNDLNGAVMPSSTTTYQYDAYGNPTQIVVSTSDGSVKTTTNTYKAPDLVKWIHGRLETASVTSTVPDTAYTGNLAPGAGDDELAVAKDTAKTFDPRTNDRDPNGDALTITAASGASHGTLTVINGGTEIEYVPATGYEGSDSFTYTLSDGSATGTGTVSVEVIANNVAPSAVDDLLNVTEDQPATFDPRLNDSDPNSDPLTITAKTDGSHGTVTIGGGGVDVTYTPTSGYVGTDSFTYTIEDPEGLSDTATVTVDVIANTGSPLAVNDTVSVAENDSHTFDPRVNDTDPESDPLTITAKTDGANGTVAILSGGTQLSYTPAAGFFGTDSFTYTIEDPSAQSSTASVTVTVTSTNQAPAAVNDNETVTEGGVLTFDPRTNDSDPDSDPLTITAKTDGANGVVALLSGSTELSYTPSAGWSGTDTFTYTVSDPEGASSTATVTVTVTSTNQAPVAVNDAVSTDEDLATTFDPRANDSDPDSDPLTITAKTDGANGTVAITSATQVTYTPSAGWNGTDSFTYTVSDPEGATSTATVTMTVNSTNQAPVAVNDTVSTDEDVAVTIDPRGNDSDPDSDPLTITAKTDGANGTVAILSGGTQVSYTPNSGFSGTDSFTYTIADPEAATATASVDVTVDAAGILVRDSGGTLTSDYQPDIHQITHPIFLYWTTIEELSTSSVVWSSLNVNNPNPPAGWQSNGWKDGFTETGNGQEVIKEGQ